MLHFLDVMIGFVFTMLVLSLAVTAIVQAVPVYLRNLKGDALQRGLADLVLRVAGQAGIGADLERAIDTILRDPLLSPPRSPVTQWLWRAFQPPGSTADRKRARTAVVQREEFVRLLLDFAGGHDDPAVAIPLEPARVQARALLGVATADEAKAVLTKLRDRIAALELAHPEWSSSRRADQAMLEILLFGPTRNFMAKLTGWFDQTIDRVDAAFTARVRNWTTGCSFALVLLLQLDSFDLLARLNADSALRDKVVVSALSAMGDGSVKPGADAAGAAGRAKSCASKYLPVATASQPDMAGYANCMGLKQATELGLIAWPDSHIAWWAHWKTDPFPFLVQIMGIFLSAALLSLGAPFWYEMLSNLIKLRSTMSRKDEAARTERQTSQPVV